MTPELIVLGPTATVADALAQIRDPDWVVSIAAQVFVCQPPFKAPTGKFLGTAHVQRLLREAPSLELRHCVSNDPVVGPDATDRAVAELLARYDMLAVAVCDPKGQLLGAVTVDDVLDRQLGTPVAPTPRGRRPDEDRVAMVKRREDLTAPRAARRFGLGYDKEAFGQFAESIARFLGTARFLVWQTAVIIIWILWNLVVPDRLQFDPWDRGLVLLTLVLSLQASYAAPLILLAQNRQEARDRTTSENDRFVAERTQADTEFLAREIASVRLMLGDVVTGEELRDQLAELSQLDRGAHPTARRRRTADARSRESGLR